MKNVRMGVGEWADLLSKSRQIETLAPPSFLEFDVLMYYMGKRVVYSKRSDEIILFERCEYCRENNLDSNNCCTACGAPVEM